jgi:hypothetical protein
MQRQPQFIDVTRNFAPVTTQRLQPGSAAVVFDSVPK